MIQKEIQYDISDLTTNELDDYLCPVCLQINTNDLYQCANGHIAHKECWETILKLKHQCMTCQTPINSFDNLQINRVAISLLSKHMVSCPYKFSNIIKENEQLEIDEINGCTETVILYALKSHIADCDHRFMYCENGPNGCSEIIRFNQYNQHIETCEFQMVKCELCYSEHILNQANEHLEQCPSIIIDCHQCQEQVKRGEMDHHLRELCEEQMIECTFAKYGCFQLVKRNQLVNHLSEDCNNHISLIGDSASLLEMQHQNLLNIIEIQKGSNEALINQKHNQLLNEMQDRYISSISVNPIEYTNTWTINKYPSIESIESPEIKIGPFSFNLKVKRGYYLRLYLKKKEDYPININFKARLINHIDQKHSIEQELNYGKDKSSNNYGFGWKKYAFCSFVNNKGFILDNSITFEIQFKITNIIKPLISNN